MLVGWGDPPSNGDIAVSLCLLVGFGRAVIFTFPLVSCLGRLGDIVIRAISGLMVLLAVHDPDSEGRNCGRVDGGSGAHGKLPKPPKPSNDLKRE